ARETLRMNEAGAHGRAAGIASPGREMLPGASSKAPDGLAQDRAPGLIRFTDAATSLSAGISALGLLAMIGVICYEVFARYVLNSPTSWVAEIAAYLLVAIAFLGLAAAQRAKAHIRVELLLGMLPPKAEAEL